MKKQLMILMTAALLLAGCNSNEEEDALKQYGDVYKRQDRISMKGIGNGVSMIIAAGIISRLPYQFTTAWQTLVDPSNSSATFNGILTFGLYIVSYLLIIVFVVFMQTAERKIPIQYTSSTVTTRKKDMTYLPLKINSASVIPVIFASEMCIRDSCTHCVQISIMLGKKHLRLTVV